MQDQESSSGDLRPDGLPAGMRGRWELESGLLGEGPFVYEFGGLTLSDTGFDVPGI